jgi:hypothetical protein
MAIVRSLSGGSISAAVGTRIGGYASTKPIVARSAIVNAALSGVIWTPEYPRGQRGPYLYVVGIPRVGVEAVSFLYWCPGCVSLHLFDHDVDGSPSGKLQFDGNYDSPTVDKLIKQESEGKCHHTMTAGVIEYQGSCFHALAGQSVPMVANATIFTTLDQSVDENAS